MIQALFKMCGVKTEVYSGDIDDNKRRKILEVFNSEKNRYGDKIKVLLVTEAGAEGINILEAQHMHILESSVREMKIQQAIGRVVRYKSHLVPGRKKMPKSEQVVHIWRYWSISGPEPVIIEKKLPNGDIKRDVITDKAGVDYILYKKGLLQMKLMESFLTMLKQASVTPYDTSIDEESKLEDFSDAVMSPIIAEACIESSIRFKNSDYEFMNKSKVITKHTNIFPDLANIIAEYAKPTTPPTIIDLLEHSDDEKMNS